MTITSTPCSISTSTTQFSAACADLQRDWATSLPPVLAQVRRPELLKEVEKVGGAFQKFSTLIIVGIGGSSLGLRAVVSALNPSRHIIICDALDPDPLRKLLATVDWSKTAINIISKSGGTLEIMAIASVLIDALKTKVGNSWTDHVVVTTDPETGFLRQWARDHKLATCQIPADVGGRFSIFTAVGILPMVWAGMDVQKFWKGADAAIGAALQVAPENSLPLQLAAQHVAWDQAGRSQSVIMPYATCLMDYARWFVQLWAESLGKDGKGQTPIVAVGSADQHAQLQMFAEGPKNKLIRFLTVEQWPEDLTVPTPLDGNAQYLKGKRFGTLLTTAAAAMSDALAQVECPSYTLRLPAVTAESLGFLMMTDIMMTVAGGKLYDVNPYGQPGVELGKKLWRERLST
jgi:glucose-6-phosphate isomerase